jgi:hypothetical protein
MRVAWRESGSICDQFLRLTRSAKRFHGRTLRMGPARKSLGSCSSLARPTNTTKPWEYNEAMGSCNDIASLKAWVVHGPLVCSFGVLLVGWRRARHPRVGDKFLRPATRTLYAFLLLFSRQRGVGEALRFLRADDAPEPAAPAPTPSHRPLRQRSPGGPSRR